VRVQLADAQQPFILESGASIAPIELEYEVYGELSPDRDNVVLITHALSGDAHAAGWDADAGDRGRAWRNDRPGWWDAMIGPGKPIDTRRWCVICSSVLGGCYGTTGPASSDPTTGKPYGLRFPLVTVEDWVRLQARLLDHLGVERLHAVLGGSLGGQQALEWALAFPERVGKCAVLAASPRLSAQGLAFNAVGRYCIINDPHFADGDYYEDEGPAKGLAAARMLAHITYLSEEAMHEKFGRMRRDRERSDAGFGIEFEVESYLDYQGRSFVERFDANSYLYISRAMDYYDAAERWGDGDLVEACKRIDCDVLVTSFSTDWLYPPEQCREFVSALCRLGKPVTAIELPSTAGHDAFLVEISSLGPLLANFLESTADTGDAPPAKAAEGAGR